MTQQALAAAMKDRRIQLGLTHKTAVDAALTGISIALWSKLENGHPGPYRPSTYAAVDRALQWPHGTSGFLAEGTAGELVTPPTPDVAARIQMDEALEALGVAIARLQDQADEADRCLAELAQRVASLESPPLPRGTKRAR